MKVLQEALGRHREGTRNLIKAEQGFQKLWESHKASWLAGQREPSSHPLYLLLEWLCQSTALYGAASDQIHANSVSSDGEIYEYQATNIKRTWPRRPSSKTNKPLQLVDQQGKGMALLG